MNKKHILAIGLLVLCFQANTHAAERNVLFVLDASGSMWGQVEGKNKIQVAREVMGQAVTDLDENIDVGLMAYGHRTKGDCKDIELVSPVGQSRTSLLEVMHGLNPKGKTPLSDSLLQAVEALRSVEGQASVVLVSDGLETCEGDPCAAAKAAVESGVNLNIHVIGFDVSDEEAEQLQCIADNGNGRYFDADNAEQLAEAFGVVTRNEPVPEKPATGTVRLVTKFPHKDPQFIDSESNLIELEDIRRNANEFDLLPGTYQVKFGSVKREVEVRAGETVDVHLGQISVVIPESSGKLIDYAGVYEQESGNYIFVTTSPGHYRAIPTGVYKLKFTGASKLIENIEVRADEETKVEVGLITMPSGYSSVRIRDVVSNASLGILHGGRNGNAQSYPAPAGKYHLKSMYDEKLDTVVEVIAGEEVIVK